MSNDCPKKMSKMRSFIPLTLDASDKSSITQIESLHGISASSSRSTADIERLQSRHDAIERAVCAAVQQLKAAVKFDDVEAIRALLMPKILLDLNEIDLNSQARLQEDVQETKQTLFSYIQHAIVMDQDIANIFLDLHDIYLKLERFDGRKMPKEQVEQFSNRLKQVELLQNQSKRYINNERPPSVLQFPCAEDLKDEVEQSDNDMVISYGGSLLHLNQINRQLQVAMPSTTSDLATKSVIELAEKRTFMANMVTFKKSEFTMQLNRFKAYYKEAREAVEKCVEEEEKETVEK